MNNNRRNSRKSDLGGFSAYDYVDPYALNRPGKDMAVDEGFQPDEVLQKSATAYSPVWVMGMYLQIRDLSEALTDTIAKAEEKEEWNIQRWLVLIRDKIDRIAPADALEHPEHYRKFIDDLRDFVESRKIT